MRKGMICVPYRRESTRFPGKLDEDVCGKRVVDWTMENCLDASQVLGGKIPVHLLASNYGGEPHNGTERCALFVKSLPEAERPEFVVNVQGDWPTIPYRLIADFYDTVADGDHRLLTACINSHRVNRSNAVKMSACFSRHFHDYRCLHVGMYAYTVEMLEWYLQQPPSRGEIDEDLEQLRFEENMRSFDRCIMGDFRSHEIFGIDMPEDLEEFRKLKADQLVRPEIYA